MKTHFMISKFELILCQCRKSDLELEYVGNMKFKSHVIKSEI